jgi:hypothetical protein
VFELSHPDVPEFKAGKIHGPHFLPILGIVVQKFKSNASIGEFTMAVIKKFINGSGINDFFKSLWIGNIFKVGTEFNLNVRMV